MVIEIESEFNLNPKTLGFDPLAHGQCEEQLIPSLRVNSCADLFVPDPHPSFVCNGRTQICARVKDHKSICHKKEWASQPVL